jgi:hypothetical protein
VLGLAFCYSYMTIALIGSILRPWVGMIAFYGLVFLNMEWNWRWVIAANSGLQQKVAICIIVGFVLSAFPGQRIRGVPLASSLCFLGFLGLAYVSATTTIDPYLTDFYMKYIWKVVIMALLAIRLVDDDRKLMTLMWFIALGQGYNAYQINDDYYNVGYCRFIQGTGWGWIGSNQISNLSLCAVAICCGLMFFSDRMWKKALAAILLILNAHVVLIMESRGCMLGMILFGLLTLIFMPRNSQTMLLAGLAGIGVALLVGPSVVEEFSTIFVKGEELDSSASSRFDLWRAGWAITLDNFLLGVGPYAGQALVPQYLAVGMGLVEYLEIRNKGLHNLFFEVSTGCGFPAAVLYVSFFLLPWISATLIVSRRKSFQELTNSQKAALFTSVTGIPSFWVCNMFSAGSLLEGSYALVVIANAAVLIHQNRALSYLNESRAIRKRSLPVARNPQGSFLVGQVRGQTSQATNQQYQVSGRRS